MVSSLVQDLAPPDSVVRPTKPAGAASNSSCDVQQQGSKGRVAAAAGAAAEEPGASDKAPAGRAAKGCAANKQRDSKAPAALEADAAPGEAKRRGKPCRADADFKHNAEPKHAAKRKAKAAKDASNTDLVLADAKLRGAASKKSKAAEESHEAAQMPDNAKQEGAGKAQGKEAKGAREKGKAACQEAKRARPEDYAAAGAQAKGAAKAASRAVEAAIDAKMEASPTAAGAAADRPQRKRASKQPYWLAQVCRLKAMHDAYMTTYLLVRIKTGGANISAEVFMMQVSTGGSLVHTADLPHFELSLGTGLVEMCKTPEVHRVPENAHCYMPIRKQHVLCDMSSAGSVPCCGRRTQ